jgi:hypothetical protein
MIDAHTYACMCTHTHISSSRMLTYTVRTLHIIAAETLLSEGDMSKLKTAHSRIVKLHEKENESKKQRR